MVETIKRRTLAGQFARTGSSGARARRYADGTSPVDLSESGQMLASLEGRTSYNKKAIRVEVDTGDGRSSLLAHIHNTEGTPAGRGRRQRIRRRFLFLNEGEWDAVVLNAMRRAGMRRGTRGRKGDRL
jgi:hypothetical protein